MFWEVFLGVLAANILFSGAIAVFAWIDERKKIKKSNQEIDELKSESVNTAVQRMAERVKNGESNLKPKDILNCEEWVDWIPENKYLEKGYYDYTAECHDILKEVSEKLLEVKEYNPIEEYAPGGNLGPVEPEDVEGVIAETEILVTIMKHHGATILELGKVCKYYQVLIAADQFELDWKEAAKNFGIEMLSKKYFGEVYNQ